MKNPAAALLSLAILLVPLRASVAGGVSFDGQWWQSHGMPARMALIQGEVDGLSSMCGRMLIPVAYNAASGGRSASDDDREATRWLARFRESLDRWAGACGYTHKFGLYLGVVSNFYLEHPAARRVTVGQILVCYNDAVLKNGRPARCVAATQQYFR